MKFSIITACLNRRALIGDAIESVLAQDHPDVEHLIVDGGSTDGTLEQIERYPHLKVVSEPDTGIYDAWNKGLARCTGDIVGILNSDDMYAPGVFADVVRSLRANPEAELVTGTALQFAEEDAAWRVIRRYEETPGKFLALERLIFWGPIINARFMRAELYRSVGHFDSGYRIAADCDFMLRLARERPRSVYLDKCVYYYRSHAGSASLNEHGASDRTSFSEKLTIAETWLSRQELPVSDARTIRQRHAEMAAIATLSFLFRREAGEAREFFRRGMRWARPFAAAVVRELVRIFVHQVTKRLRPEGPEVMPPAAGRLVRQDATAGGGGNNAR